MPKYRNVSGVDLYVVAVSKLVEEDGVFEVTDAEAPGFDCQPSNYDRLAVAKKKSDKESE